MANLQCLQKILFYFHHRSASVHPYTALKMKIETAEVKMGGPYCRSSIIRYEGFSVNKAFGVFIDLHAGVDQLPIVGSCGHVYRPLVPLVRCNDAHIHAALGGKAERGYHTVVDDQVRC